MTLTLSQPQTYTAEEYLALEVESDTRHEYRRGEIVSLTGGTPAREETSNSVCLDIEG